MSGFEIAGIALAAPAVVDLLLKVGREGYKVSSAAQSLPNVFPDYIHRFEVSRQKLDDWVKENAAEIRKCEEQRKKLIIQTLGKISQVHASVQKMQDVYGSQQVPATAGLQQVSDPVSTWTKIRGKVSWDSASRKSRKSVRPPTPQAPEAGQTSTDTAAHADFITMLGIDIDTTQLDILGPEVKRAYSIISRANWAFLDQDILEALLTDLEKYNRDLFDLTKQGWHSRSPPGIYCIPCLQTPRCMADPWRLR